MKKHLCIILLFSLILLTSCGKEISFYESKSDSLFETVVIDKKGGVSAFGLKKGNSFEDILKRGLSPEDFDLSQMEDHGVATLHQPVYFSETGNADALLSFRFLDGKLFTLSIHVTFMNTPVEDAWNTVFQICDYYDSQFDADVYRNAVGPEREALREGSKDNFMLEWLPDADNGISIRAASYDTADWKYKSQAECVRFDMVIKIA